MKKSSQIGLSDLGHVGPGTPAGEWFRRYWIVVGTTRDLHDIPQGVRILGEDLVLFRDPEGKVGLLGLHCPHRGTSLEYGDIEDGGIRCPYCGWLFDVHGQCLEMRRSRSVKRCGKATPELNRSTKARCAHPVNPDANDFGTAAMAISRASTSK